MVDGQGTVACITEYLLENTVLCVKNQRRFAGKRKTFIFSLRKNERKKAYPFDGNSPECRLSL